MMEMLLPLKLSSLMLFDMKELSPMMLGPPNPEEALLREEGPDPLSADDVKRTEVRLPP